MNRKNLAWLDLLRITACFLVVLAHCCDHFVAKSDSNYSEFLSGVFWGSFYRPCVPLFIMITGVLLFPVKIDMVFFYRKRLPRIVYPLIVWSIITPIFFYLYVNSGIEIVSPNINSATYTWDATVNKISTFIFNFNSDTIPFWYLYMLIGIYLIAPIISAWLTQAKQKDIKLFLWIWVGTTVLPYVQMFAPSLGYSGNYGNMGLHGICDWNTFGMFHYISGFIGYIVLAHYLIRFPLNWSWSKIIVVAIPMWTIGYVITLLGFIMTQKYYPGDYAKLEIVWYFCGINVLMMTFPFFTIIQKIKIKSSPALKKLASLTFGIYLCHFLIALICYDYIYVHVPIPSWLQIPLIASVAFLFSAVVSWGLSKLPKSKYIVG